MKRVFTISERTHGQGPVYFNWQKDKSKYITTGSDHTIIIHNRHGQKIDQINLQGNCLGFCWDFQGDTMAVITDKSSIILLWDSSNHKTLRVDSSFRDSLSLVIWAKKSHLLAVASSKGNLLIYNHQISRKVPIIGKHSKRINSGSWSEDNLLALTGEDRKLTVSNYDGDTLCQSNLKGDPSLVQFNSIKFNDIRSSYVENCVSLALNKKSIFFLDVHNPENPTNVTFEEKYGMIVDYQWFGEGYILIGWSSGHLMVISARAKEIGQEIAVTKAYSNGLSNIAISISSNKLACCNENVVKLYNLEDINDVKCILPVDDEKTIEWMEWTEDGQMIAMASDSGCVHIYLVKLTIVGSCFGSRLAFLSSLLEVTVLNVTENSNEVAAILKLDVEPSLIAVGPYHVAICMNNRVWFYALIDNDNQLLLKEKEYSAIIKSILLNSDYVAILYTNGKLYIHLIENHEQARDDHENKEAKLFNEGAVNDSGKITTMALTNEFLIYATDSGSIEYFYLDDWTTVNVYRHSCGIKQLASALSGIRIVVIDDLNESFIYNPVNDSIIAIKEPSNFPTNVKKILWESYFINKNNFAIIDDKNIYIYVYVRDSIEGECVQYFDKVKIPSCQYPLLYYNSSMICQTDSGKSSSFALVNYDLTGKLTERGKLRNEILPIILKLRRYQDSWKICAYLSDTEAWREFGKQALIDLDTELALRIFRSIGDAGIVFTLEKLKCIEERNLLAGYISLCLENYDLAQKHFLTSSRPIEALEMRQNLQDWNAALLLANRLAPQTIPLISREYATQLEFQGDYHLALEHYKNGFLENVKINDERIVNHNKRCKAGIARCSIKCGNTKFGVELALQLEDDHSMHLECAEILESFKLYTDAALLYEKGQDYEKAAKIYLKIKNSRKVDELTNSKGINGKDVLTQFAKIEETEGRYLKAVDAYLKAKDYLNAIRILLDHIKNPAQAIEIVKETKLVEGSKMIAKFFQKMNDTSSAIEFLVLSKCNDEAFQLASSTGQIDTYANVLIERYKDEQDEKSLSDFQSLAIFYEQNKNLLKAGQFYCLAGQSQKGIKLLIQSASFNCNEEEALKMAIDSVSKVKDEQVIRYLIDYLIGEVDGVPKDFKYLFRLYISLKQYKEAAKTAVIISREEQNAGNYRKAHGLIFGMCQELRKQKINISLEMQNSLMLIHSYLLAKAWIKIGDHFKSAQLLIRIANNISKFPSHVIPILTSAVVECQRANLKKYALQYASLLIKPEHRDQIEPKLKKKIEALVRKSAGLRDNLDTSETTEIGNLTPCPHCDNDLLETELVCYNCRNTIPFCIATGHHLIKNDLTCCPSCHFPSILSQLTRYLKAEPSCPMCGANIDPNNLKKIIEPSYLLNI